MAGQADAKMRQKLGELETLLGRVQTIHGLVERYAAERGDLNPHVTGLRRAFVRLKTELAGLGFDSMAQVCAAMDQAARRGGSLQFKVRILRDGVGSLRMQLEVEQRLVRAESEARARAEREADGVD
jgi:HPt (histidine-containing phosphotransfer) domain-containing protein